MQIYNLNARRWGKLVYGAPFNKSGYQVYGAGLMTKLAVPTGLDNQSKQESA